MRNAFAMPALFRFGAWPEHMRVEDFCEEGVMSQIGIPPVRVDFLTSVSGLEFSGCWDRRGVVKLGAAESRCWVWLT